jgi:hypothetical protein
VQILDPQTAVVLISYPRQTRERIVIDPACYSLAGPELPIIPVETWV